MAVNVKMNDLMDHINSLEAKLTVLTKQVIVLEEVFGKRQVEAMKPTSFINKVKGMFNRG